VGVGGGCRTDRADTTSATGPSAAVVSLATGHIPVSAGTDQVRNGASSVVPANATTINNGTRTPSTVCTARTGVRRAWGVNPEAGPAVSM
jgi:hypothetical protein